MAVTWQSVGEWVKNNAGTGAQLVGDLITGNVPAAVAKGVALVTGATGTSSPDAALEALKNNPESVIRLKELYLEDEKDIREHIEVMHRLESEDRQHEHEQTQTTIRGGDTATDKVIRMTRPDMAKQSWKATVAYSLSCFLFEAFTGKDIFDPYIAGFLAAPAFAYLGLRQTGKWMDSWASTKIKQNTKTDSLG